VHVSLKFKNNRTLNLEPVIPRINIIQTRSTSPGISNANVAKKWLQMKLMECASKHNFRTRIELFSDYAILRHM
jgi:hypothetical protein